QGGDNAGHTVVIGDEVFKLHLVPSGVLHPSITPVIGSGVVVNPKTLISEMDMLAERGIGPSRLRVSRAAHVIMPYHVALDGATEAHLSGQEIGTTRRGIGPAYADRAWRAGVRMGDLLDAKTLRTRLALVLPERNTILTETYGMPGFDLDELTAEALAWGERLRAHIVDTTTLVQAALAADKLVILEGAQGTLLDLDHGTYPYVTSSNPIAGGACTGGGVGPLQIGQVIGVLKAYSTRVGSGPFPTELDDEAGRYLLEKGHEYGTTTGRVRRCGWFDAVPLRYAVAINSVSHVMLNKLDILSGMETLRIATAYRVDGQTAPWPHRVADLERAEPQYEEFPGWEPDISGARSMDDLPPEAIAYVEAIEDLAGAPIAIVSVGPERNQTIMRKELKSARPGLT
ncbi:MAG: adenylosuccinate synthase, partial [Chloroflexota bacterium]